MRTLIFAAVLGLVCSLLLAAVGRFTEPYRRANERAEEIRNFLGVLNVPGVAEADTATLIEIFDTQVTPREQGGLTLYEYRPAGGDQGAPEAVAVPFSGPGLWASIKGVMALEPDMTTIRGISFYKQEETPGLGGDIGTPRFQDLFRGKRLVAVDGRPGFRIVKPGTGSDENSVDGITGATMTSDRVAAILDTLAKNLEKARTQP